jgi:hypothetical protein
MIRRLGLLVDRIKWRPCLTLVLAIFVIAAGRHTATAQDQQCTNSVLLDSICSATDWISDPTDGVGSLIIICQVVESSVSDSGSILIQVYPGTGTAAGDSDLALAVIRDLFMRLDSVLSEVHLSHSASSNSSVDEGSSQPDETESYLPGSRQLAW